MVKSEFHFMQYLIAGSSQTLGEVLQELSTSPQVCVRRNVAENTAAPLSVLNFLLYDEDPEVRQSLSANPSVPKAFLRHLALDQSVDVRYALAENAHMPVEILTVLSRDENPYVAHRASRTLQRLSEGLPLALAS